MYLEWHTKRQLKKNPKAHNTYHRCLTWDLFLIKLNDDPGTKVSIKPNNILLLLYYYYCYIIIVIKSLISIVKNLY